MHNWAAVLDFTQTLSCAIPAPFKGNDQSASIGHVGLESSSKPPIRPQNFQVYRPTSQRPTSQHLNTVNLIGREDEQIEGLLFV